MPKFTVDTQLFRELGELLVGRDSTALVELVKNAYDAGATGVVVYGEGLDSPETGRITITDDGTGMSAQQFEDGFLRIASRLKSHGDRRSIKYYRRYTGEKGIGRLAAHKLARFVSIESVPYVGERDASRPIAATIDWDAVEALSTLDEVASSEAITLQTDKPRASSGTGTTIALSRLRRRWTPGERTRFFSEVTSFTPPEQLVELPCGVVDSGVLFERARTRDSKASDPGFRVDLEGEFSVGEEYWIALAQTADWVLEIDAPRGSREPDSPDPLVRYRISPTVKHKTTKEPDAEMREYAIPHSSPEDGPFFQARVLIREGHLESENRTPRGWLNRSHGVRVFMEGFRVLPYGEEGNDWLRLDYDYVRRVRQLEYIKDLPVGEPADEDEGLNTLRNSSYYGAVFLTAEDAPKLRMLVNREGFIPEGFDTLFNLVRIGIDLSTRVRALSSQERRELRSDTRKEKLVQAEVRRALREQVEDAVDRAAHFAHEAREHAVSGDLETAVQMINRAAQEFSRASETSERLMTERAMMQVLAAVGLQMAAFIHDTNALLGMASTLEITLAQIVESDCLPPNAQARLRQVMSLVGDLRRSIERQSLYLVDVVSPDARRRRSRQPFAERFDAGSRLVETSAMRRGVQIVNEIPNDIRTPPMFPAEITLVFTNLLTNAVKAAGEGGRVWAHASGEGNKTRVCIENTGTTVSPSDAERWFRPLESTTTDVDPVLGQGMGMGLPITRNILSEYGAIIRFVEPSPGYAAAIELTFEG